MQFDGRQVWSFTTLSQRMKAVAMISNNCQSCEVRLAQRLASEQTTARAILSGQTQMYDRWACALLYAIKLLNVHAHKQFNFGRDRVSLCSISAINQSTSIWQVTWKTKTIWLALIDEKSNPPLYNWCGGLGRRPKTPLLSWTRRELTIKETSGSSCTSR